MIPRFAKLFVLAPLAFGLARADLDVYDDNNLAGSWQNWSWNTDINFAATDIFKGSSSLSATSTAWAALSLKLGDGSFSSMAGLKFDISGAAPELQIYFESVNEGISSPTIPITALSKTPITAGAWTSVLIDFKALPPSGASLPAANWDRLNFQALGNGASYHLDNIVFVSQIVVTPLFLSAEPLANDLVAVTTQGAVDLSKLAVKINNSTVAISKKTTYVPVDTPSRSITYLTLASALKPGSLVITAGNTTFSHTLPAVKYGTINTPNTTPISPLIYGVNFPTSASYITHLGVTISRWGGNAVTAYNPFGGFTNAGNDWYFENRASDSADDWIGWVDGAGSKTMVTVPALDWVSKDASSYSYPKSIYPNQKAFDPYNADAGNGQDPTTNTYVQPPPDPTRVYTPWNTTLAKKWLSGLVHKPQIITIDNEIEIASSTHQDMHPNPMSYDEELQRVVTYATAAKEAIPGVQVAAPSPCSWWFYWTSSVGWTDTTAHGNTDFIPWFLAQMKAKSTTAGKRLLDYLDIHYYFQPDTSANDATAKALRLRMTRSLWDPSYVDESWIGTDPQCHQPNNRAVWLIPRMKQLIADNYPGTKLSISEWASTADGDITGGLVTADVLGIFGRYGVDSATYWATPDEKGPVGLAYWLYRGYGTLFGKNSVQVNMADRNEDVLGVYAATENSKVSLVIINKDTKPIGLYISNVPTGNYFLRHFGGAAGVAKWQTNINLKSNTYTVVPAYTAIFLQQA